MPQIDIYNLAHEKVGRIDLDDAVFAAEVKPHLFWETVRYQLARRRRGTACTKERSAVRGSTKKLFRQKGTGNARQGARRSPVHVGGGTVFGPHPRSFAFKVPKKVRRNALRCALSQRLLENKLIVIDEFALDTIKTKRVAAVMQNFGVQSALIVDERNERLAKSARNLPRVQFLPTEGVNVYDVLRYENLILTVSAAKMIEGALRP